jgi:tetratricopeptide (TPR) repeat protein
MKRGAAAQVVVPVTAAVALLSLLLTACGGSRRPSLAAQLLIADGLAAEGCYRCLDEAVVRYVALPPARGLVARANDTRLFRALVLLALREKELGLDPAQRLRQAGLLVARTTAPAAAREQLKFAELVPGNPSGLPRDAAEAERARLMPVSAELEQRLARSAAMTDPLDVYLNVSLACSPLFQVKAPDPAAVAAPAATHPIVRWRLSICGRTHEDALRAFAAAQPRYVEADYWIGRYRVAAGSGAATSISLFSDPAARREARQRMQAALAAIPESLAIAYDLAGVTRVTSPRDALPLYERVTRAQPRHNEAWLGQGICLTYLERPREAIDALTRVVDLGRWSVGDAYYWRAWNRHAIGELDAAWNDSEAARRSLYNTNVFALSGRIAFDQTKLDVARPLLEKAIELSGENCGAAWYLGLIHSTQERWLAGGDAFTTAEACYRGEIERIRAEQQRTAATEVEDTVRAERQAAADASIRVAERQAALAAYNAAFNLVRGGQPARSRPLLDRAVEHPDVSDRARELRAFVDRPDGAAPR